MSEAEPEFVKRKCARCGISELVPAASVEALCDDCRADQIDVGDEPGERTVSRFWSESRNSAGALTGQAFTALDDFFNPAAARAKELLKADHERQVPIPSPGDDALRQGKLVIRVPKPDVPQDI